MGIHDDIGVAAVTVLPFDWHAFRAGLAEAVAGTAPATSRRKADLAGRMCDIALTRHPPGETLDADPEGIVATVRFGTATAEIVASRAFLQGLVDVRGIEQDCGVLKDETATLVAQHLLSPTAGALETVFGGEMQILPCDKSIDGAEDWPAATIEVDLGAGPVAIRLRAPSALLDRFAGLFPPGGRAPRIVVPVGMPVALTLRSADFQISAQEIEDLTQGDVIALDPRWDPDATARLTAGARALGEVARDRETGLYRLTAHAEGPDDEDRSLTMTNATTPDRPAPSPRGAARPRPSEPGPQAALEALPVVVSVELERSEMALGELRKLSVGTVLPFSGEMTGRVTLLANGEAFARGELVRIGERTGVRILALD